MTDKENPQQNELSVVLESLAIFKNKTYSKLVVLEGLLDKMYVDRILPEKMKYNLQYIENFNFWNDIGVMFRTVFGGES